MKKTNRIETDNKVTVDIVGLQALLSCGIVTAKQIAEKAGATLCIGRRRLYNVEKIKEYINRMGA